MDISQTIPIVDILKVGITGFGFLLAYLAYRLHSQLNGVIANAKNISEATTARMLKSSERYQNFAMAFFVIAVLITGVDLAIGSKEHDVAIEVHPTRLKDDEMPLINRDGSVIKVEHNAAKFRINSKTLLSVDVDPLKAKLDNAVAITSQQLTSRSPRQQDSPLQPE